MVGNDLVLSSEVNGHGLPYLYLYYIAMNRGHTHCKGQLCAYWGMLPHFPVVVGQLCAHWGMFPHFPVVVAD